MNSPALKPSGHDAAEIKSMLADRAESVAAYLLPAGKQIGPEWQAGDVSGAPGQSLSVHLTGDKAGVWADFATGEGGDLLDLWQAVRGCDFPTALREASDWLGLAPAVPVQSVQRQPARPVRVFNEPPAGVDGLSRFAYTDADKRTVIYVTREDRDGKKIIRQWGKSADGKGWQCNLDHAPKPRPLYRLPALIATDLVCIHEGEKAVVAATKARLPGTHTTTIGGAGNARHSDFMPLQGKAVVIVPDNDEPGEKHGEQVAKLAHEAGAKSVRTLRLPDLPEKGDVVEWLEDGGDAKAWAALIESAEIYNPQDCEKSLWPEPLPALPDVLPFDCSYLPDSLRGYVMDISERMQCPPDFAAVGAFIMMATLLGRKVGMRPMRHNDWTVIPNLWGAVIGNSGVMKSPTLSAVLSPLNRLASAEFEAFNKAMGEYDAQAELAKLQESVNKTKARQSLKKDQSADVKSLLQSSETDDAPILKRYKTNNASYEALGELLMENPNGLMVEADEIIGLLKQLDASGQEVARSFYLTAADGDKSYTFDRIMRGKGLHIDALCLSIIGGIQPGVLAEYVRQATGGGAGADGLLQRFGLMVYPDISPDWHEVDRYPDKYLREAVNLLAERLDNMNPADIGAEVDQYGGVPFLRFDDAAQVLFSEWRGALEHRLRSGEEHPAIVSHLSKYRKLIPSLALINHLCDADHGAAVSEAALLRAITYGEYLESHARRIYSYATRPDIDAAKTLLKRLSTGKLSNPFKARDVYRAGWAGLETQAKAQTAISLLLEYHHLVEEEITTGGRPTSHFYLNGGARG